MSKYEWEVIGEPMVRHMACAILGALESDDEDILRSSLLVAMTLAEQFGVAEVRFTGTPRIALYRTSGEEVCFNTDHPLELRACAWMTLNFLGVQEEKINKKTPPIEPQEAKWLREFSKERIEKILRELEIATANNQRGPAAMQARAEGVVSAFGLMLGLGVERNENGDIINLRFDSPTLSTYRKDFSPRALKTLICAILQDQGIEAPASLVYKPTRQRKK